MPEGYVRFLNEDEERQYLAQSPPSNTLLPRDHDFLLASSGEDTPRQPNLIKEWNTDSGEVGNDGNDGYDDVEWVDEPKAELEPDGAVDGITGVQDVQDVDIRK